MATPPAPPDAQEMATRQLVQGMAMNGASAKQAPSIATAPEAMQTAMARSTAINAPTNFNATQQAMIQNPFSRADSELAAANAGAGGIQGAINASTSDYMQQAQAALPLQMEISKRAVQKMLSDQASDARKAALDERQMAIAEKEIKEKEDPNSLTNRLKKAEDEKKLRELGIRPLTNVEASREAGIDAGRINQLETLPQYSTALSGFNTMMKEAKLSGTSPQNADQFAATIQAGLNQAAVDQEFLDAKGDPLPPDQQNAVALQLYKLLSAQLGSQLEGYKSTAGATSNVPNRPLTAEGVAQGAAAVQAANAPAPAVPVLPKAPGLYDSLFPNQPQAAAAAAGAAPAAPHWQAAQVGVAPKTSSAQEVAMLRQAASAHGMSFDEYMNMLKKAAKSKKK